MAAEARGFIFGGALARELGVGFVPARKPGKLPARDDQRAVRARVRRSTTLELHADALRGGTRVLIHDDVLATGGTAKAKIDLVEQLGGRVVGCAFVVELAFLDGAGATRRLRRARPGRLRAASTCSPWRSTNVGPTPLIAASSSSVDGFSAAIDSSVLLCATV